MKFVTAAGVLSKARRFVSGSGSVRDEEVKDPAKLAEVIRQMQRRISELESVTPPEPIEFEVTVGVGGAITSLLHKFNGPVRWTVVLWTNTGGVPAPHLPPMLVRDTSSTSNTLALRSYVEGRAIIRVELSQSEIETGVSAGQTCSLMGLTQKAMAGTNQVLTAAEWAPPTFICTGALGAAKTITVPFHPTSDDNAYIKFLKNACTGGFAVTWTTGTGTTFAIGSGGFSAALFTTAGVQQFGPW